MSNERIWAPWRLGYIKSTQTDPTLRRPLTLAPGGDPNCFLCRVLADTLDRENLVVARGPHTIVVLNRYPYNNGHLLVAPRQHKARLQDLDTEEQVGIERDLARFVALLEQEINAEGFNVGLNLGRVAGAGVPGHLHWHIVPRWAADANFMTTLASTQVIPQALDALWELLQTALAKEA